VVRRRPFGVSTRLYQHQRLSREHLVEIAAHGFETVELFASPTHVDYRNPSVVADLQQWLAEARLELHSIQAPIGSMSGNAPDEVEQALFIARRIPLKVFITRTEGTRDTVRRGVERIAELARPLGVKVAVEAGPDDASPPASLVHLVEEEIDNDDGEAGIALDFGREQRRGDLIDAIETVAEHLIAVRVPLESSIDWPSALTTVQKIGYEGPLVFDIDGRGSTKETLARAKTAREKMERWLTST
jgi:sugar phosphate isomerase/epimerase